MNSFQSSSINSPLAALVQKAGSFFPSKALNMWWHLPGRIFSRAVKVENVPVLGRPQHQTLQTWLTTINLLTCSDQNIFHIFIHLLLRWSKVHVNRYTINLLLPNCRCVRTVRSCGPILYTLHTQCYRGRGLRMFTFTHQNSTLVVPSNRSGNSLSI